VHGRDRQNDHSRRISPALPCKEYAGLRSRRHMAGERLQTGLPAPGFTPAGGVLSRNVDNRWDTAAPVERLREVKQTCHYGLGEEL
jgi:hypothetical protein